MVVLKLVHILSIWLLLGVFAVSAVLAFLAVHNLAYAIILSFLNIIGASFPPSPSLVDAPNPFILSSVAIGLVGNLAFTILITTIFYQLLSKTSISEWVAKQKLSKMKSHVVISPINMLSMELAKLLKNNKIPVVFIDESRRKVRQAIHSGFVAMTGDATNASTLARARLGSALAFFALNDDDLKNVLATIAAKRTNDKCSVISRISRIDDVPKLERAGARRIILPEKAVGEELGNYIISKF